MVVGVTGEDVEGEAGEELAQVAFGSVNLARTSSASAS